MDQSSQQMIESYFEWDQQPIVTNSSRCELEQQYENSNMPSMKYLKLTSKSISSFSYEADFDYHLKKLNPSNNFTITIQKCHVTP